MPVREHPHAAQRFDSSALLVLRLDLLNWWLSAETRRAGTGELRAGSLTEHAVDTPPLAAPKEFEGLPRAPLRRALELRRMPIERPRVPAARCGVPRPRFGAPEELPLQHTSFARPRRASGALDPRLVACCRRHGPRRR
jgi:hypothetical protein